MNKKLQNKGAIALTTMVVLGAVIILTIITIVLLGISARFNTFNTSKSNIAFIKSEGCLEEGLIHLKRDDTYTGDTYDIDGLNCDVTVTGSGDERTIEIDSEEDNYYHHFSVEVQINPTFAILDFSY